MKNKTLVIVLMAPISMNVPIFDKEFKHGVQDILTRITHFCECVQIIKTIHMNMVGQWVVTFGFKKENLIFFGIISS
jgi:hypothetical protein